MRIWGWNLRAYLGWPLVYVIVIGHSTFSWVEVGRLSGVQCILFNRVNCDRKMSFRTLKLSHNSSK